MITGTKDMLDQIAKTHVCPEHGPKLVVAWHAGEKSYVLRCGDGTHKELAPLKLGETQQREVIVQGHFPEEVTGQETLTEMLKRGEELPPTIKDNVEKGLRKRGVASLTQSATNQLDLMPKADLGTGEALNSQMIVALYQYARQYGLDAYRGHVMLMHGKPYIGLDGYLFYANKQQIPYQLRSRPLTEDERKTYRIGENDHAWTCEVVLPLTNQSFTGLGVVTQAEMVAISTKKPNQLRSPVVAAHPWQLAQKRAEWQALRRAFPIGESEEVKDET